MVPNSHRKGLLKDLREALVSFGRGGCKSVSIDGSFVTKKDNPNDYDATWDNEGVNYDFIDPVPVNFKDGNDAMKRKYGGEFYPDTLLSKKGISLLDFFQIDRRQRKKKESLK